MQAPGLGAADPLLSQVYYTGLFLGLTETGIVLKAFEKINACSLQSKEANRVERTLKRSLAKQCLVNCLFLHSFNVFC